MQNNPRNLLRKSNRPTSRKNQQAVYSIKYKQYTIISNSKVHSYFSGAVYIYKVRIFFNAALSACRQRKQNAEALLAPERNEYLYYLSFFSFLVLVTNAMNGFLFTINGFIYLIRLHAFIVYVTRIKNFLNFGQDIDSMIC